MFTVWQKGTYNKKMRFALVFPPFKYKIHEENIRIVQKYFGLFPPLNEMWVAAIAERAGHECVIIDARTFQLNPVETVEILKAFKPDIVGFRVVTYMYPETRQWIKHIKNELGVLTIIGGYNMRIYPNESVQPSEIDFGCVGSALYTVPRLFEELEGKQNFENVPGLVYKKNGRMIQTPPSDRPESFEDYPNPARHLIANELYAEFPTTRKNFTTMVTSKGCPMHCSFCEAGGTSYNPRSTMTVVNEMEECVRKFNIREIDIFDYEFPLIKKRTMDICKEIQKRKLDFIWACRSRVDSVDEELLGEMKKAGCHRIYFGIESAHQDILNKVNKGITTEQVCQTIRLCKNLGITTLGFFLIGNPGETEEMIYENVKFAEMLDLDYVQFSKLLAKPGTPLWREMVKLEGRDYWKEWILGREEDKPLPRHWTCLSSGDIDRIAKNCYMKFSSRPSYLVKQALKCGSFSEFRKKFKAYLDMIFSQEKISTRDENFIAYNDIRYFDRRRAMENLWGNNFEKIRAK